MLKNNSGYVRKEQKHLFLRNLIITYTSEFIFLNHHIGLLAM